MLLDVFPLCYPSVIVSNQIPSYLINNLLRARIRLKAVSVSKTVAINNIVRLAVTLIALFHLLVNTFMDRSLSHCFIVFFVTDLHAS